MVILITTLTKMLELFLFIIIGFVLRKRKILPENSGRVLALLENNILMPSLILNTFITRCTVYNLKANSDMVMYEILIIFAVLLFSCFVAKFLAKNKYEEGIFRYALTIPNYAFMGNAIVESVFGNEMLYKYMMLTIPLNIFAYTVGVSWLKQEKNEEKKRIKFNPIVFALAMGIILGISEINIPEFAMSGIENAGKCMAPIAMILTGFIIGEYRFTTLLKEISVYVAVTLRLIIIPTIVWIVLSFLGVNKEAVMLIICALAMPVGLNTIIISAAYGRDTLKGASLTLISHIFSVVTIPIIITVVMN